MRRKFNWKFIFKTFEIREISRQLINRLFPKLRVLNTHLLYWHNNNSTVAKVNSINRIIERDTSHWTKHSFSPFFSQSTILFMNRSCLKSFERPNSSFRIHHAINTTSNQCLDVADPWNTTIYIPPDGIIFIVTRERFEYSQMDPFGSSVHLNIQWFVRLFVRAVLSLPSFPHCSNQIFLTARVRHKGLCHRSW